MKKPQKLLIFEGLDNTGKSTIINILQNIFLKANITSNKIIFTNPVPKIISVEDMITDISETTRNYYDAKLSQIYSAMFSFDLILLDRSWISEYVYGPLYRDRDKNEIIYDIMEYEYSIIDRFGIDNIYLFTLMSRNIEFLQQHEDGKSLSYADKDKILTEITEFSDIFDISLIKHKYMYDVYDKKTKTYSNKIIPNILKNIIN